MAMWEPAELELADRVIPVQVSARPGPRPPSGPPLHYSGLIEAEDPSALRPLFVGRSRHLLRFPDGVTAWISIKSWQRGQASRFIGVPPP